MNSNESAVPIENRIPALYETESVPVDEKVIQQRYLIKGIGFYWLLAELDPKENLAFGYTNLNDDEMAEWGIDRHLRASLQRCRLGHRLQAVHILPGKEEDRERESF